MSWIDCLIVIIPFALIMYLAFHSRRYARSVVDFLAAGRVAGRYVICVGDLATALSVITLVSYSEIYYQQGFAVAFWNMVLVPVGLVMGLTGFCNYRWRQIRCLSKGQFLEMRYGSRVFRIVTAVISTIAEAITNAIGPAIAANFFIYYLGLPHRVMICGIGLPCYVIIVALCLLVATLVILPAGRISLLITDSIQGLMTYPIFVMIAGFILLKFSWGDDIAPVLMDRVSQQSFLNPYDISDFRDFNVFALVVTLTQTVMNRCAWYGNDTTNSGRTPHEQKMAGVMGAWRNGFSRVALISLALVSITFMNSEKFAAPNKFGVTSGEIRRELSLRILDSLLADAPEKQATVKAAVVAATATDSAAGHPHPQSQTENMNTACLQAVSDAIGDSPADRATFQEYKTLFHQQMMPFVTRKIFPAGLFGAFCLLMVMLLISTDDSRLFNAVGCIIQDIVLPCMKRRLSPQTHIRLLRWGTVAMAFAFFAVAVFFRNIDFINMFTTIMCAFWTSAAGPVMTFGLYTRFGNLTGAWSALVLGSGSSLAGLLLQRHWATAVFPWIERHGWTEACDHALRSLSRPFNPWIHWEMNSDKFPINSMELSFLSMLLAVLAYVIGSWLTYRPFDLDKMLHRGAYADADTQTPPPGKASRALRLSSLVGITPEYSSFDKVIAWSVFLYSFVYQFLLCFIAVIIWNRFSRWPIGRWSRFAWFYYLLVPTVVGLVSTVWFGIGGVRDTLRLFRDLKKRKEDPDDNGQVSL